MDTGRVRRNLLAVFAVLGFWSALFQWAGAQSQIVQSQEVPLSQAFQVLGIIAERDVMLLNIPGNAVVELPQQVDDWQGLMTAMAGAHGLAWCLVGWNIVVGPEGKVCADDETINAAVAEMAGSDAEATAEAAQDFTGDGDQHVAASAEREALGLRLRVVQIDERRAAELGLNWSGGVFETASNLIQGGRFIVGGVFPPPVFDEIVRFLETEGVAMRLEDVSLGGVVGERFAFNRGGSINVTLARETAVERSYTYGLGLDVDVEPNGSEGSYVLRYRFDDSSPAVQSTELVELAATTSSGTVVAACGETVVLASAVSLRMEGEGAGLPVVSSVPGLGYLGGSGSDRSTTGSFVVTLEPLCIA